MDKTTFKRRLKKIITKQAEVAKGDTNKKLSELDAAFAIKELQMGNKE